MYLVMYHSAYYDKDSYMWFRTEEEAMEFIDTCKELRNRIDNAFEIKELRRLVI